MCGYASPSRSRGDVTQLAHEEPAVHVAPRSRAPLHTHGSKQNRSDNAGQQTESKGKRRIHTKSNKMRCSARFLVSEPLVLPFERSLGLVSRLSLIAVSCARSARRMRASRAAERLKNKMDSTKKSVKIMLEKLGELSSCLSLATLSSCLFL